MTPLARDPRDPRVSSQKLDVAVFYNELGAVSLPIFFKMLYCFYNEFGTCARPTFYKKLDVGGFYNEFSTFARPIFY